VVARARCKGAAAEGRLAIQPARVLPDAPPVASGPAPRPGWTPELPRPRPPERDVAQDGRKPLRPRALALGQVARVRVRGVSILLAHLVSRRPSR
jgi:hypothetical protein